MSSTAAPELDIAALQESAICGDLQAVREQLIPLAPAFVAFLQPDTCDLALLEALQLQALHQHDGQGIGAPLLAAVVRCFLENVRDPGAFVRARDSRGRTLLHFLCWAGLHEIVDLLAGRQAELGGLDVNAAAEGEGGVTPLHVAAFHGHAAVVDALGRWQELQLAAVSDAGASALHWAACAGGAGAAEVVETVVYLCRGLYAAPVSDLVNARDGLGLTPLHYAAHQGHPNVVATLLQAAGGEIQLNCAVPERRMLTPLHLAALSSRSGCDQVVRLLLAHACTSSRSSGTGSGNRLVRRLPRAAAADPNARIACSSSKQSGCSCRSSSNDGSSSGTTTTLASLARSLTRFVPSGAVGPGFSSHRLASTEKWLPDAPPPDLHDAVCGGDALRNLVTWAEGRDHGASVQVRFQRGGATALHLAALRNSVLVAEALLDDRSYAAADAGARDAYGMTPLHYAAAGGQAAMVNLLVDHPRGRVNVNAATDEEGRYWGYTALHLAVRTGNLQAAQALCSWLGLDANAVNWEEKTALEMSWERGNASLIKEVLLQRDDMKRFMKRLVLRQQTLQQGGSALLVGATLIASLFLELSSKLSTSQGVLHVLFLEMTPTDLLYCSFVLSFLAIICGIAAVLPSLLHRNGHDDTFIGTVVRRMQRGIAASTCSLAAAIFLALLTFDDLYSKAPALEYGGYGSSPPPAPQDTTVHPRFGTTIAGKLVLLLIYAVFFIPLLGFPLLSLLTSLGRDPFRLRILLQVFLPSSLVPKSMKLLARYVHDVLWSFVIGFYVLGGMFLGSSPEIVEFFTMVLTKRKRSAPSVPVFGVWMAFTFVVLVGIALERSKGRATKILTVVTLPVWFVWILVVQPYVPVFLLIPVVAGVLDVFLERCFSCCGGYLFHSCHRDRKRRKEC